MPAQRYRELAQPSVIDTGIAQANAGSTADALARTFSEFGQVADALGGQLRSEQGQVEGDAAGYGIGQKDPVTGKPVAKFREGLGGLTAYGQAYNNAATRTYAIKLEADADETEARIRAQAGNDPDKYREMMLAAQTGLEKEADPRALALIRNTYVPRIARGVSQLITVRDTEVKNENRVATQEGLTQSIDRVGRLRSEGDHRGAEEEKVKMDLMLQAAEADGTFTPAEMKKLRRQADVGFLSQEETQNFTAELQRADGDPQAFIERLKADYAKSEVLTSDEEDQIVDSLFQAWHQHNTMATARRAEEVAQQTASVMDVFTRRGQAAGASALAGIKDPAVRDKVLQAINDRRAVAREANVEDLVSVARAEAQGTVGDDTYVTLENLYEQGALTPEEYASKTGALDTSRIKKSGDIAVAAEVQRSLEFGTPLDPTNKKVKKALASAFSVQTSGMQEGSAEWQATTLAFAARTRMLPDQAVAWIEKNRRSPDPTMVVPAAQMITSLHATAPQALEGIDDKTRAYASVINDFVSAGTDPIKAVENAKAQVYGTDKAITEMLKERYRKEKVDDSSSGALNSFIDRDFDTLFSSQPDAPLDMQASFRAQAERYYGMTGGDVTKARELAWQDVKSMYGVTEVNGTKMLMMAPPEEFGVKPEEVRKDLQDLATRLGTTSENWIIVPDAKTQAAVVDISTGRKSQPSYIIKDGNGQFVFDKGLKQRYYLPGGDELAAKFEQTRAEAEAKESADMSRVRAYRDARRKDIGARKSGFGDY